MNQSIADLNSLDDYGEMHGDDYRPISWFAVLSFVIGLGTPLSLLHPLLIVLPILGVLIGSATIVVLRLNASIATGRWMAVTGLVISAFFLGLGPGRTIYRRSVLEQHAREFIAAFLSELQSGRVYQAHERTLVVPERAAVGVDLEEHYRPTEEEVAADPEAFAFMPGSSPYRTFRTSFADQNIQKLIQWGTNATPELVETESIAYTGKDQSDTVTQIYRFAPPKGIKGKPITMKIQFRRGLYKGRLFQQITRFEPK